MLAIIEEYSLLVQYTLIFASVLMLVALGGCFSEHSGVINLGLEGIMVMGALGGALCMYFLQDKLPSFPMLILTVIAAAASGALYSALLGVACINFKADQTIVGTALNLLGTAVAAVVVQAIKLAETGSPSDELLYRTGRAAFTNSFKIGNTVVEFNWFIVIAIIMLVIAYIVLYKTKFGLRLMACGEHPQAAASVGVSVYKMRWSGVLISGVYGGLGGICYVMAGGGSWHFSYGVAGFGFLLLAVMIFGQWKPARIALAALLFGFFRALSNVNGSITLLKDLNIPGTVYNMLPYIVSLIVLAFTSKKSRAPKAEGIPYDKGMR